jgi:dTMP kinase
MVKKYLRGDFGDNVDPYVSSTFYAVDRFASLQEDFKDFMVDKDMIMISDRYTTANMVHQASKIGDWYERYKFLSWLDDLEYGHMGLPRPDMVILLNIPYEKSLELMQMRLNKFTDEKDKDIHERSKEHIKNAYHCSLDLALQYGWTKIDCIDKRGNLKTRELIASEVYAIVKSTVLSK